jgi:hypothetical protein
VRHQAGGLTFSKPKNLSLPSPRRGPALRSSFSSGVTSGALGSFLTGMLPVAGLKGGCGQTCQWQPLATGARDSGSLLGTYSTRLDATEKGTHGWGVVRKQGRVGCRRWRRTNATALQATGARSWERVGEAGAGCGPREMSGAKGNMEAFASLEE